MIKLTELHAKYNFGNEEIISIGEVIIKTYTIGIRTEAIPKAIILGGQPGAGKSELIKIARTIHNKNTVVCNADEYRDFHPHAEEIKRLYEAFYPEITVAYAQQWNNMLRKHCEDNRYNFILETTFSSGKIMNETIRELKQKGYEVSVMVLAVNKQISFLGTRIRYEEMKARDKYGRMVDKAAHDDKYLKVAETLELVQKEKGYDHIYIYGRAGNQNLKGKHNGLIEISHNSKTPLADYITEREKEWTDNDISYFMGRILLLVRMMVERKAPHDELKMVLDVFEMS